MKGLAELTVELERSYPDSYDRGFWGRDDELDDGDVAVVRIGGDRAVIEATYTSRADEAKDWIRTVLRDRRRRRGNLIAGLCVFRGPAPEPRSFRPFPGGSRQRKPPSTGPDPIGAFALCLGGSHVLLFDGMLCEGVPKLGPLADFLADQSISVCCLGAAAAAKQLGQELGLHLGWPVELRNLAVKAYGKQVEVEDEGRKQLVAVQRMGLEDMAEMALGKEMRMGTWPQKVVNEASWGSGGCKEDAAMYAARDAFLCFEIALKCYNKLGFRH